MPSSGQSREPFFPPKIPSALRSHFSPSKRTKQVQPGCRSAANCQTWEKYMFNSCPRKIFCANTPLPTAEALVWWAGACQPGSSSDVSNPQCGTLINAARRRCVWVTPCVLLCYTLVLRGSAAPQVTLLKHACRASILSLRRAIRALLQTSAAERGGKDPVGLPLMNWNHPSSFGTPLWVKLIQIKMASEACLTPAGIT